MEKMLADGNFVNQIILIALGAHNLRNPMENSFVD
jgi:hypothetical protein